MKSFNDYLKEAALSAKQKKIAAIAGDKEKIDADDLAALRSGKKPVEEAKDGWSDNDSLAKPVTSNQAMADHAKYFNKVTKLDPKTGEPVKKPVEEASCSGKDMKKEELIGNQHKLDKNKNGKLDAQDFKMLRKEEAEQIDEISKDTLKSYIPKAAKSSRIHGMISTDYKNRAERVRRPGLKKALANLSDKYRSKAWSREDMIGKAVNKLTKEDVQIDEGKMKELSMDLTDMGHDEFHKKYGNPKSHYDPTNFKKPVQPGKEMERARALAQRGMQSLTKEEAEAIEEKLAQLGEGTYKPEVEKSFPASGVKTGASAPKGTSTMPKDKEKAKGQPAGSIGEETEQIDELSKKTLGSYVKKASNDAVQSTHDERDAFDDMDDKEAARMTHRVGNRLDGLKRAATKLAKEEVEQEMSPYLKATLQVMDEAKIDDLRDAQKLRAATKSAYDKDYKVDTSHPSITVNKGTAYGGAAQKDDVNSDENPIKKYDHGKRGRPAGYKTGAGGYNVGKAGRPHGSKSGARLKGSKKDDDESGGIPTHTLHLPNSNK